MSSFVAIESLANGVRQGNDGRALRDHTIYVYRRGTYPDAPEQVQLYQDEGITPLAQPVITAGNGAVPGYAESLTPIDLYDQTTGEVVRAEPVAAVDVPQLNVPNGAARLGSDGKVGGPGGSPLSGSVAKDIFSTRTNYCPNPTVEADLSHITKVTGLASSTSLTRSNGWAADGSWSVEVSGNVTSDGGYVLAQVVDNGQVPALPGQVWGASAEVNVISPSSAGGNGTYLRIQFLDGSNAVLASVVSPNGNLLTGVQKLEVLGVAPTGTVSVILQVIEQCKSGDTVHFYTDSFLLEKLATSLADVFAPLPDPSTCELYDNPVGKPDGLLTTALTGQPYVLSVGGTGSNMEIESQKITAPTPVAGSAYAEVPLSDTVKRIGIENVWDPGSGDDTAFTLAVWDVSIASTSPDKPNSPFHISITSETWGVLYWEDNAFFSIASGFFASRLPDDDATIGRTDIVFDGDIAVVHLPDGSYIALKHPKIAEFTGDWTNYEVNGTFNTGSGRPRITKLWADPQPIDTGLTLDDYFPTQAQLAAGEAVWAGAANNSASVLAPSGFALVGPDGRLSVQQAPTVLTIGTHANRLAAAHQKNNMWKETDTGLIYYDDGAAWQTFRGNGKVSKTADETVNNSATPQTDDHLFFPIEPNEIWFVRAFLLCRGASTTGDWRFTFVGPTGATAQWARYVSTEWVSVLAGSTPGVVSALGTQLSVGGASGVIAIQLAGWFFADSSHAGQIALGWAQGTATAEDNTILKGSFLELERIA